MSPRRSTLAALIASLALLLPAACKKVIGDSCTANSDCSISADRICDLSQTGGYCSIPGCEPGSCPDNGVCVYFDAHASRLRRRFCMAGCNDDTDCRDDYRCVFPNPETCVSEPLCRLPPPASPMPSRTCAPDDVVEALPAGQSCNRIVDPEPQYAGWCVQAR